MVVGKITRFRITIYVTVLVRKVFDSIHDPKHNKFRIRITPDSTPCYSTVLRAYLSSKTYAVLYVGTHVCVINVGQIELDLT